VKLNSALNATILNHGILFAFSRSAGAGEPLRQVAEARMSDRMDSTQSSDGPDQANGRRRQLRNLILSAADAARQSRRVEQIARVTRPMGRAVRDRISLLLTAAG
jgi:hypothetical protein